MLINRGAHQDDRAALHDDEDRTQANARRTHAAQGLYGPTTVSDGYCRLHGSAESKTLPLRNNSRLWKTTVL